MPVLLVVGYGPGNSHSIARRFGREGWTIALIGRSEKRLNEGVTRLESAGVAAHAFVGDASDPVSLHAAVDRVREQLGPIVSVAFTAYRHVIVDNVLATDPAVVDQVFTIGVTGLLTVVQSVLADLQAAEHASILVVNGDLGTRDDAVDAYAVSFGGDGVALECSAKTKLVGLLAARLRDDGIYVGEIVINGSIKGSPFASSTAIDPDDIAERCWSMAQARTDVHTHVAEQHT